MEGVFKGGRDLNHTLGRALAHHNRCYGWVCGLGTVATSLIFGLIRGT
jgi:hypothetical protein